MFPLCGKDKPLRSPKSMNFGCASGASAATRYGSLLVRETAFRLPDNALPTYLLIFSPPLPARLLGRYIRTNRTWSGNAQATQKARARWEESQKSAMEKAAAEAVEEREKALEDARRVSERDDKMKTISNGDLLGDGRYRVAHWCCRLGHTRARHKNLP